LKGLIVISFLLAAPGCRSGEEGATPTFPEAATAAEHFRSLITKDNYKKLGFDSLEESAGAQLGAPLPIFFVRLDRLREYQPGSDANTLLSDSAQVHYPVLIKKQVGAAVIVQKADGKWKIASLGNAGLAKQISQVQQKAAAPSGEPDMIVRVPALGIYFIGRRGADKKLILIPVADDPRYNLKSTAEQPAEEVFAKLVPFAKTHKGLPT
jgi:hypothetical protein